MLCQECKKNPATVHVTKIINNVKTEFHLCQRCAGERDDLNWFSPFSINDLLTGFLEPIKSTMAAEAAPAIRCDKCGMDYRQFKKTGRFGCDNCYSVFKGEIHPIIKRIQGGASRHTGKSPARQDSRLKTNKEIEDLKRQLQGAINIEAFEEAAKLRDRIKDLEKKQEQGG
ncbi:MAG TPA: UvrB/UvrC motif-containing protein [Clostridia bacterium]|nr:UvrB/UvrC motif-containing protein [Clostridia bacterium]